jgi:hypothetical protein
MMFAAVILGVDAVLAGVLWWMTRSGWMRDDQRYRRKR